MNDLNKWFISNFIDKKTFSYRGVELEQNKVHLVDMNEHHVIAKYLVPNQKSGMKISRKFLGMPSYKKPNPLIRPIFENFRKPWN